MSESDFVVVGARASQHAHLVRHGVPTRGCKNCEMKKPPYTFFISKRRIENGMPGVLVICVYRRGVDLLPQVVFIFWDQNFIDANFFQFL
jgi:hypothetical protein